MGSRNNKPGRIVKGTALQPSLKSASGVWSLDEAMQAHRANAWPQPNLFQPVANSLRFKNSSASALVRQPGRPGNQRTWTWSAWIKLGIFSGTREFFNGSPSGTAFSGIRTIDGQIYIQDYSSSGGYNIWWVSSAVYRDTSAWYHMVVKYDTTQTQGNAAILYVNGVQQTLTFGGAVGAYAQNRPSWINAPNTQRFGQNIGGDYYDGQIGEVNFVDGYALQPTLFGQYDTNNTWVPIPYTGSYGTNGFYLPFNNATTSQTLGYDASLNGTTTYDVDQDPYRGSVSLHLTGNGPAGGNNNVFADSSPNNFAITRNGDATQGSFSPFPMPANAPYNPAINGASAYFDGTGDFLTVPANSAFNLGTGDFTIEFWAYLNPYVAFGGSASYWAEIIGINVGVSDSNSVTNTLGIWQGDGTGSSTVAGEYTVIISGSSANQQRLHSGITSYNKWSHVALTRSSGTFTLWQDGVSRATASLSADISRNDYVRIGRSINSGIQGSISNIRVIKGTAVYTSAFTPTNKPFGPLTNNLLTFSEDFTNSYWTQSSITVTPSAAVAPDGNPGATKLTASSTGSISPQIYKYPNPNLSNSTTYTLSVYAKAAEYNYIVLNNNDGLGSYRTWFNLTTGTVGTNASGNTASMVSVGNGWYRCIVYRTMAASSAANSLQGIQISNADAADTFSATSGSGIYIWGAQIEQGTSATNYTPTPANFSTAPSLLLNFANAAVVDTVGGDNIVTGSGATITSSSKYGSGAMTFNGTSDFVAAATGASYTFGTTNFTAEFWVYFNSVAATQCVAAAYNSGGANATSPLSWTIRSNGVLGWEGNFGSIDFIGNGLTPIATVTANTWNHVATVRNNGEIIAFLNGRVVGRVSVGTGSGVAPAGGVHIGRAGQYAGQYFNGSVDDFRVTKGVARYTSDFTPPSRALPEIGGKSFVTTNVNAGVVQRFTTVGTTSWTAPTDVTQVEVLVVGGGGSGGSNNAGGGGGGGVIYNNQYPVTPGQTYTVTVGAGGISQAGSGGTNSGYQGTLSQFGNLVATPGCGGYGGNGQRGQESGSGSGGGGCRGVGPGAGFPGQGFSGGANRVSPEGGGGGGAGGAGGTGPGNGGPGLQFGISGTPTYYAGGGGGGAEATPNSPVAGAGGLGGGGAGGAVSGATYAAGWSSGSGQAGTANTGGGGGGESAGNAGFVTGAGGSGVVIVRYTTTAVGNTSDATTDNLTDSPTQYGHDMGLGGEVVGNYATLNPLALPSGATLSNGNLTITGVTAYRTTPATIAMTSGKWYWENKLLTYTGSDIHVGVCLGNFTSFQGTWVLSTAFGWGYNCQGGYGYHNNTGKNISSSARSTGDTIGLAFDADGGNLYAYVNGVVVNGGSPIYTGLTSGPYFPFVTTGDSNTNVAVNFGQRAWAYAPPAGFNALTTKNLPRLTNAAAIAPNQYFDTVLYTGTGSARSVSGFNFEPDLLWVKDRSTSAYHRLFDRVRGVTNSPGLYSNDTSSEGADNLTFTSTGFSYTTDPYSTGMNVNGNLHVVWGWKAGGTAVSNTSGTITSQVSANTTSGFSIVSYTGTGVQATVGHGLPTAPSFIILKSRTNATRNWATYHSSFVPGEFIYLNSDGAKASDNSSWGPVTSTTFQLGNGVTPNSSWNQSGNTFIAYCWAEVAGFSKFGTYTGNGSADGPFIYTGFKPRFVMVKSSTNTFRWIIWDTARDPINFATRGLAPNLAAAEVTAFDADILSNGFKLRDLEGTLNESSGTYIYMAFADKPFGNVNGVAR